MFILQEIKNLYKNKTFCEKVKYHFTKRYLREMRKINDKFSTKL